MTSLSPVRPSLVLAAILDGPLTPLAEAEVLRASRGRVDGPGLAGARLRFEGVVRRDEADRDRGGLPRTLSSLDYQTYDPMAQRSLEALARNVADRHGLHSIVVLHSRGSVRVGEVSFVLEVTSARRAESLAAMTDFIDRLKQDVPIWKRPVWA